MSEIVRLEHIQKIYHSKRSETLALQDIDFAVSNKEFVAIIGPSGCGKSTILSLIAGLEAPSSGNIYINGEKKHGTVCTDIGYMLQQDHLFPWLSIRQNAMLGLDIRHQRSADNEKKVDLLLDQYELGAFSQSFPSQLSGGMRQRAALIRTLALEPKILLLDEPFSALDYQTRLNVANDISQIIRSSGKTAILVTHDISEAISMADRIIVLTKRPATIKSEHVVSLSCGSDSPLIRRRAPEFSQYFQKLWEELNNE